ncbi:MAG: preprotein translocase subunit YajC [Actinobacteria bacterium]|uniref:Preprotein translocase subunit YajC n=1 Tax=Nostocoides veronense TaxID=330836 RepID=A0ABN2L969_9MICO|nr:preprotein translocase subunit YajC [Actinomycetota bacterium]
MHSGLATATASNGIPMANLLLLLLPLLLLFWMVTNQRRRMRTVQTMQQALQVGDEVVMTSGLFGRIAAFEGEKVVLQVAPGVQLRFDRRAIGAKAPDAPDAVSPADGVEN